MEGAVRAAEATEYPSTRLSGITRVPWSWFVRIITGIRTGCTTWFGVSTLADMTMVRNDVHVCEPYSYNEWICIYCGGRYERKPICPKCYEDPELKEHECEFGEALVEGFCPWAAPKNHVHDVTEQELRIDFIDNGHAPGIPAS